MINILLISGLSYNVTISIVNKTKLACPVDVSHEEQICGTDNRTYESLCRMILEADDVNVWFDGPCNRSDCHGNVSVS